MKKNFIITEDQTKLNFTCTLLFFQVIMFVQDKIVKDSLIRIIIPLFFQ